MPVAFFPPANFVSVMQQQQQRPEQQQTPYVGPPVYPTMIFGWGNDGFGGGVNNGAVFVGPPGYGGGGSQGPPSDYSDVSVRPPPPPPWHQPDLVSNWHRQVGPSSAVASSQAKEDSAPASAPDVIKMEGGERQEEHLYMNDEELKGSSSTEPTYQNELEVKQQQPLYENQSELEDQQQQQPTYANEDDDRHRSPPRFPRGASLPPMFCDELAASSPGAAPPVAPPRSRRGSRLSLDRSSTQSVNLAGLVERFEDLKASVDKLKIAKEKANASGKSGPKRPPRRRFRKTKDASGFSTLPRNFKTRSLGIINEDTFNMAAEKDELEGCLHMWYSNYW